MPHTCSHHKSDLCCVLTQSNFIWSKSLNTYMCDMFQVSNDSEPTKNFNLSKVYNKIIFSQFLSCHESLSPDFPFLLLLSPLDLFLSLPCLLDSTLEFSIFAFSPQSVRHQSAAETEPFLNTIEIK